LIHQLIKIRCEDVHAEDRRHSVSITATIYEFIVMLFELANAPTVFIDLMNKVFCNYLDGFVVVFIDHVMVYSTNHQQHKDQLGLGLGLG
jgi:hypothetical protein